jgi:phosphoserine phosphatase RsbU/P
VPPLQENNGSRSEESLRSVLRDDLRKIPLRRNISREFRDLKEFYIDDERKQRLASMGNLKRWFHQFFWLLQSLFLKLNPIRRILALTGAIFIAMGHSFNFTIGSVQTGSDPAVLGGLLMLFVLMLELKDKLLAHDELEAGKAVQMALLPDSTPSIPGWSCWLYSRTANEVGGDLIDSQEVAQGQFRLSLADVAGKGLSAALVTAKLQATIRAYAAEPIPLADLVGKVNRIFYRDKIKSTFASLSYIELDAVSPALRMVNAGHLPPLILQSGVITEMPKGEPAIGVMPETLYTSTERECRNGDVILIYSDGLSEAKNASGDFYGAARVAELLKALGHFDAPKIGERLIESCNLFVGDAPVHDDLSLIVLKRTS